MRAPIFYVTDHVFDNLDIEEGIVSGVKGRLIVDAVSATPDQWLERAREADVVVTCHAVLPASFIEALERCVVIARYGVGIDNVDLEAATRAGIAVTHVPDYCVNEVSTHTLAMLLALNRRVVQLDRATRQGRWHASDAGPVRRLSGQVLGLVGFGRNARAVAEKAASFGLVVVAYDPLVAPADLESVGVQPVGLVELLETSDFVSLHVPLTDGTYHMIDEQALQRMKGTAYLINTARGGLVDTEALRVALDRGLIAGAGIDVLEQEPPDVPLGCDSAVVTPHTAFASTESIADLKRLTFERAVDVLEGRRPAVLANPAVWDNRRRWVTDVSGIGR